MDGKAAKPQSAHDAGVLVVEDDPKLGPLLIRALDACGARGDLADSAESALVMAAGHDYAAVLIDQMLPGTDGLELCRRLRRGGLGVPAVIMSARDDLAGQIGPSGADGYLVKPFALDLLLATLRSLPAASRAGSRWRDDGGPGGRRT